MGKRRKSRELALQCLYELDLHGAGGLLRFEEFWERHSADEEVQAFTEELVRGAREHQEKIDELIAQFAENWRLDRMAVVDRNILRLAVYELLERPSVPPKVAINEAIEISKKFGTEDSSRFINGILDRVHKELRAAS